MSSGWFNPSKPVRWWWLYSHYFTPTVPCFFSHSTSNSTPVLLITPIILMIVLLFYWRLYSHSSDDFTPILLTFYESFFQSSTWWLYSLSTDCSTDESIHPHCTDQSTLILLIILLPLHWALYWWFYSHSTDHSTFWWFYSHSTDHSTDEKNKISFNSLISRMSQIVDTKKCHVKSNITTEVPCQLAKLSRMRVVWSTNSNLFESHFDESPVATHPILIAHSTAVWTVNIR